MYTLYIASFKKVLEHTIYFEHRSRMFGREMGRSRSEKDKNNLQNRTLSIQTRRINET